MYSNPPMNYPYLTPSSHQWSIPPTYPTNPSFTTPTTPSFPSFPWEIFTPSYTHGSSSPNLYQHHGYSPHHSYIYPSHSHVYPNYYNNIHEPHTHHTTEQLLTSHPLFTQHQTVNDSTYMGSHYQEATHQINYQEISLVKKKSCQLSKLRFSSLLSVKTDKNKRGKRRTITRKEKRASEPKTLRFSTTLPTISSEPQMLDPKTEPPDNNDLTVDDYNEAHDIVLTSDFQPIRSLPVFNPNFGSSFAKTWNSDFNLDHRRNLDQETEAIIVTTPQLKRKGEAVGFEADLGVRMTPGSTEPTDGSYLMSVSKDFSSLTSILSREDHPPLSESQAVGVVASSQANYMRVVVQSVPEESSGGVELLCIVRALLKKIKRRVTVGDKVLVGFIDWVDRRGMIENVFLMFLRSNGVVVFAYETCALDLLEATYERKVFPGEVVTVDGNRIQSLCLMSHPQPKQCIFEHTYFALPNYVVFGRSVYESRRRFGKVLNTESPVDFDVMIAVPDSSVVAELGNARKMPLNFPVIIRKELKETMRALVRSIKMVVIPSVYFKSIIKLLHHSDKNFGKKALGLLCDAARNHEKLSVALKDNKGSRSSFPWLHMDESSQESLDKMCLKILQVLDESSNTSLKVAAVSALEVLTERFPSNSSIFGVCLGSITKCITSHNLAVNSRCLRTSAALINVLGPKALAEASSIVLSFSVLAFSSFTIPFNGHFVSSPLSVSIATVIEIVFTLNNYNDTLITFHSSNNISMLQAQPSQHALPWYCHWTLLPHHLAMHPYSQPTLPFGHFTDNGAATPAGLVAASLSHAFALFVAVSVGANISGGHVNPAVTFGAFVGGHITLVRGLLYWIAQLLGSVVACLLLKIATGGLETSAFSLSSIGEFGSNFRTLRTRFK